MKNAKDMKVMKGEGSKIEWCDFTFNPWIGCTKVSPGCANCYAEALDQRWGYTEGGWGKGRLRKRTSNENWRKVQRWARRAGELGFKECSRCGWRGFLKDGEELGGCPREECMGVRLAVQRPRVFCASLADVADPEVPVDWFLDLMRLVKLTPELDWLMLTKRPGLFMERVTVGAWQLKNDPAVDEKRDELFHFLVTWYMGGPPRNVWLGTSVEDQRRADERIPELIEMPAWRYFLSCEPLLGPVDLFNHLCQPDSVVDWVIVGGESGPGCREFHGDWARSIRHDCALGEVRFFMKQMGGAGSRMRPIPDDLIVREFPTSAV